MRGANPVLALGRGKTEEMRLLWELVGPVLELYRNERAVRLGRSNFIAEFSGDDLAALDRLLAKKEGA